jgi:uncharacterized membrane protein
VGGVDRLGPQEGRVSLLGLLSPAPAETEGLRETLRLLDLPAGWIVALVVLPLLAGVAWLGYARESIAPRWRWVLASLRFASLLVLFLVLCRPVFVERREEVHPAEVLVVLDDSASMRRRDTYTDQEDVRTRLREATGLEPAATRSELVRGAVRRELLPDLEERGYVPRLFAFAESSRPLLSLDELAGRGQGTHVGDALTQLLASQRGRHVTDVVLLSDGRSNGGLPVLDAGRAAGAAGIPVHTVVVGDARPERNALIELVEAPASVLEGDELAVTVRVIGRGATAGTTGQIVLEELTGDQERPVAEREVTLDEGGERAVLEAPSGTPDPERGERRFRVSVLPVPGETLTDDNAVEFSVHVSTEKVRVLYVDGYPRWEYRFLKELLKRADENIEVQCFLLSATSDFVQESSQGVPPLAALPTTRVDLLDAYDVIVLGDVDPRGVSNDPDRAWEFMEAVRGFVEGGGGLLLQAGEFDNPRSFAHTPLEEVLPIVIDSVGALAAGSDARTEFRAVLEEPAAPHEIVRLHPDLETNRRLWEEDSGLRGFHWFAPVIRAKPSSQVLLRHPTESNEHGRYPLLVAGYYPQGRSLWIGVDETWRWRWHYGPRYRERFWRNSIRWLALGRLRSGDRRYRLESPRSSYGLDERVVLEARVLDEDYNPSTRPSQPIRIAGPDGRPRDETLTSIGDRPGLYRTQLELDQPGLWRAWIERDGQRLSSTEFEVVLSSRENADPSPDPEALAGLASLTGGRAVSLGRIGTLRAEFPGDEERRAPISSKLEDVWDRIATVLLLLALLSAEWSLRKRLELV